jgi:hypothetical protein
MANPCAARFLKRLIAVKCGQWAPPAASQEEYAARLGKWCLTELQWQAALDLLVDDTSLEAGLPQLPTIYGYLRRAQSAGMQTEPIWAEYLCTRSDCGFAYEGQTFVRKIRDASNPPSSDWGKLIRVIAPVGSRPRAVARPQPKPAA